ncbi:MULTISPECIES: hypothetical protein [unclassified Nostoc]|uniref:hypothetical protein n=1 Tax=unclassified Nostoc TaxID=2593658 RepID=UPI002AD45EED|nr:MULTISPECIES: hypothetical protein [unclassified Nostoc]MDZ8126631.1 hypothetical protein [Nostoc sp. CmiVER01]MDZ8227856.1 hypothetical protein [Nostoc sp. ChiVER01]
MDWLPESLLEMHFHRAIVKEYEKRFGAKCIRLLKPSPQKEVWVGFDQGWTKSDLSQQDLFMQLRSAISDGSSKLSKFYFGEFLQFKVVEVITRRSQNLPHGFTTPYYRSALSLKPNKSTNKSQHETLCRLSQIKGAKVYYACPMIFDQDILWEDPNLNLLRLVDVTTAPKGWLTNESHHIVFQNPNSRKIMWCSDPVPGSALSFEEHLELENQLSPLSGEQTISLINRTSEALRIENQEEFFQPGLFDDVRIIESQVEFFQPGLFDDVTRRESIVTRYLPESMSLYEFEY